MNPSSTLRRRFPWTETRSVLEDLLRDHRLEPSGRHFVSRDGPGITVTPPSVQPIWPSDRSSEDYLARLDDATLGRSVVVLVQAGATALGFFEDDTPLRHKVIRRYVVRGKGRAQTLHLKTRGKSRYGSRLRLQNARLQLEDTNEKLHAWWEELGAPHRVFLSCPVRTRPELFAADPPPPFEETDPTVYRVPFDVHVPDYEELLRVWRLLSHGEVLRAG